MGYSGNRLASLVQIELLHDALEEATTEVADIWLVTTVANTPIGGRFDGSERGGNLRTSWYKTLPLKTWEGGGPKWVVHIETHVEYAPHVEYGTGLWGPHHAKYPIRPKKAKMLSWINPLTGKRVFSSFVMHPGSPGQHMLAIGASRAEAQAEGTIERTLERVWVRGSERRAKAS